MRRSNSWPLLSVSDGDEPPVLLRIDSDLDIPGLDDEDDISALEITDTKHSVDSRSSVRFNIDQPGQSLDTSSIQRKGASFVTQRHLVYYSLDGEDASASLCTGPSFHPNWARYEEALGQTKFHSHNRNAKELCNRHNQPDNNTRRKGTKRQGR